MKKIVTHQYQEIVDKAALACSSLQRPQEGWLRTFRRALGMSGAQLARRLNVSRAQVAQAEQNEVSGSITLKTIAKMAESMGCRVVYALVPEGEVSDLIEKQARKKAQQLLDQTNTHMALEAQGLNKKQLSFELERVTQELINKMPADLWNDE